MTKFGEYTVEALLGPLNATERKNAPARLYTAGDVQLLAAGRRVSVVGSRDASPEGRRRAATLARELVLRNITVVSGLAKGIDTVAHETAIQENGRTIAVLGTPLDEVSPVENSALQARIISEHLAISQFAVGTKTMRGSFPMRNRTMALISDATVIVEAGEQSGSLHQGWEALRLGRPLFVLESLAKNPELEWPKNMIHYGAQILTRETLDATLSDLPVRDRDESVAF